MLRERDYERTEVEIDWTVKEERSMLVSEICLLSVGTNHGVDGLSKWKLHGVIKAASNGFGGLGLAVHQTF